MAQNLEIFNPLTYPDWDNLLLTAKQYSIFHSSAWARVLSESYGFKPLYFANVSNNRLEALFPVMEIRGKLVGQRGVSLPFTDYSEPIASSPEQLQTGFDHIVDYGKKHKWKYLITKGWELAKINTIPSAYCYRHVLTLNTDEKIVYSQFRDSTKRNIKKALSSGIKVTTHYSLESIKHYYRLHCLTRREHGLPPQPFFFFKNIFKNIISKKLGSLVLASHNNRYIAGTIFLHKKPYAIYKYSASDKIFQNFRANNLLMWESIKNFCREGYTQICLGITETNNEGLIQYKNGWTSNVARVNMLKYDILKGRFVRFDSQVKGSYNALFRAMPLPLLRLSGTILYKYMG